MKNQFNKPTIFFLILGFSLIIYGFLCRWIGFNFFWESKFIGLNVLLIAVIPFLIHRIQLKKNEANSIENIGIGFICLFTITQIISIPIIVSTNIYAQAKIFLLNDAELKTEIGNIKSFSLVPKGNINTFSSSSGSYSSDAVLYLIVKGDKKYKDVILYLEQSSEHPAWNVQYIDSE